MLLRSDNEKGKPTLWVGRIVLLFRMTLSKKTIGEDYAFIQYMELTSPISGVDEALGCACLRLATGDGINRSMDIDHHLKQDHIEVGE